MKNTILQGKTAVITGATGGIGRAIVARLSQRGMRLVLFGKDKAKLDALKLSLNTRHVQLFLVDPTKEGWKETVRRIAPKMSQTHVLVHAAGIISRAQWAKAKDEDIQAQMRVNFDFPVELTLRFLDQLKKSRGTIVFINSSSVRTKPVFFGPYVASKSALGAFADTLRGEVSEDGVSITSIYPGSTATPMQAYVRREGKSAYHPEKLIQPEDIAGAVEYILTTPPTSAVTDLFIRPFLNVKR